MNWIAEHIFGVNLRNFNDAIYAYKALMPLVESEMALRQNLNNIGNLIDIPPKQDNERALGAWLVLTRVQYTLFLPEGAKAILYNAWNKPIWTETEPGTYFLYAGKTTHTTPFVKNIIKSNTAVNRLVVTPRYADDEVVLSPASPLDSPYKDADVDVPIYNKQLAAEDIKEMGPKAFFEIASTLVVFNPTDDKRIIRGLKASDGARERFLRLVKTMAEK